jgi:hypothetical protein
MLYNLFIIRTITNMLILLIWRIKMPKENDLKEIKNQPKSYPLKMPYEIWHQARQNAIARPMTLGDYILEAISEKNERDAKK